MSLIGKVFADAKRIKKAATKMALSRSSEGPEAERAAYELYLQLERKACVADINTVCDLLESEYGDAMQRLAVIVSKRQQEVKKLTNKIMAYFITIRPSDKVSINDLMSIIEKLIKRKCFIKGVYSFEQKGMSPSTLGEGIHCHMVAHMTQRSKGEVLRDITSTFKPWIDNGLITTNNIDVRTTYNPEEIVKNYLIEYRSDDGHKEPTKVWDDQWRREAGVNPLYVFDNGSSNSPDEHMLPSILQ